jgi:hypothetical protein
MASAGQLAVQMSCMSCVSSVSQTQLGLSVNELAINLSDNLMIYYDDWFAWASAKLVTTEH